MKARFVIVVAAAAVVIFATRVDARERRVAPYLEISQTVFADLKNGGDVLTYTTLTAGVDASVRTRRTEVQVDYRYDYRVGWGNLRDSQVHSGIARARVIAVPNLLTIEAGALATRARGDNRGAVPNPSIGNPANTSQLYSIYAGPNFATQFGDLKATAIYRFGYTKVESRNNTVLPSGQPLLDSFDAATTHVATASVGMGTGRLPFGWTVSAGYEREDASQLDQRFESRNVRGDVVVPVEPTIAIVGGVGYEAIKASQRDALRDVNGTPLIDGDGRFLTDPASPRLLSYDQSGFIWDTGVVWRPSRRTSAEFRVGQRYGSMTYIGSISYRMSANMAFQAGLYDGVQTFGRQLSQGLAALPTQFTIARNPFGGGVGACVYSVAGGGACLDDALQSVATGTYRTRGVNAVWSYSRGPLKAGVGGGYAQRRFFAPVGSAFSTNGVTDQSYYLQAFIARRLDETSSIDASVYGSLFESGIAGAPSAFGAGGTAAYYRRLGSRLTGSAAVGLYATDTDSAGSSLTGSALLGARYEF